MKWMQRYYDWVFDLPTIFGLPLFVWTIVLPTAGAVIVSLAVPILVVLWIVRLLS